MKIAQHVIRIHPKRKIQVQIQEVDKNDSFKKTTHTQNVRDVL